MRKEVTQVRMDAVLKRRVRTFMERLEKKTRVPVGFSAAVRVLIEQGLEHEGIK